MTRLEAVREYVTSAFGLLIIDIDYKKEVWYITAQGRGGYQWDVECWIVTPGDHGYDYPGAIVIDNESKMYGEC